MTNDDDKDSPPEPQKPRKTSTESEKQDNIFLDDIPIKLEEMAATEDEKRELLAIELPERTDVDDKRFHRLLVNAVSLTVREKRRILAGYSALTTYQVNRLAEVFEEERAKFEALERRVAEEHAKETSSHQKALIRIQERQQKFAASEETALAGKKDELEDLKRRFRR